MEWQEYFHEVKDGCSIQRGDSRVKWRALNRVYCIALLTLRRESGVNKL